MPLGEHDYRHVRRKLRMLAIQFAEEILTEDSPMRAPSQSGEWKQIVSLDDEEGARTARSTQSPGLAYEVDADNDSPYEQLLSVTNADPLLHLLAREHQDEQHARLREVLSVLTQLPPKAQTTTRDLLRLLMLSEDFTIAEAARALGIREDHGRQLLRRFRRRVMDAVG